MSHSASLAATTPNPPPDAAIAPGRPVRVAAIGDLHLHDSVPSALTEALLSMNDVADLLVIAGDITENGRIPEGELARDLFGGITIPKIAVLGNHDRRGARRIALRRTFEAAGIQLLDGDASVIELNDGRTVGIAGVGGYGGGFWPEETPDVPGARISKAVGVRARREAVRLRHALDDIARKDLDVRLVVMHYAPTTSTLGDEPVMKYWMLGNSQLGRVIDEHAVDLVIHGHAHLGNEVGQTPGGTPVRNVATHVTGGPVLYKVAAGKQVESIPLAAEPTAAATGEGAA
ncbi:MAG: metallophosphoesterase [Thermomicrobiales bacterium]